MSKYKLDIFELLKAADRRDQEFYDRQPAEGQKGFAPRVALRWMSSVAGQNAEVQLALVNEMVNVDFDALREYPDLQYRLMALCGLGGRQNHKWIDMARQGKSPAKLQTFFFRMHPLASIAEIDSLIARHTLETFTDLVNQSGLNAQESKDLIDVFAKKDGAKTGKRKG